MTTATSGPSRTMLTALVAASRRQTDRRRTVRPLTDLTRGADRAEPARDLSAALSRPGLSLIAEMKRRSPSKGSLTDSYRPGELARVYDRSRASAISVLTHEEGFGGSPEHLRLIRPETSLPLLRKDFVTDEYQVVEARALGADAVLLIASVLSTERMAALLKCVRELGMEALVEVHDEDEVDTALEVDARVIGVNHRDLHTFGIDMTRTERLRARIGHDRVLVGESGLRSVTDARRLRRAGADAALVGESLMRSSRPEGKIEELSQV
ncbi:indole-3-glycerol phosphate synthase [Actinopolyspora lacussalsi]|nr:indole-3-glycerol phosphate synthase [Actinopolyspora lacussalsi]